MYKILHIPTAKLVVEHANDVDVFGHASCGERILDTSLYVILFKFKKDAKKYLDSYLFYTYVCNNCYIRFYDEIYIRDSPTIKKHEFDIIKEE